MLKTQFTQFMIRTGLCTVIICSAAGLAGQAPSVSAATAEASVSKASSLISFGEQFLGVKYEFGAPSGSTKTFDCSSFTQYVYGKFGISLPRSSKEQATEGIAVSKSNLQKGDLIFFSVPSRTGNAVGHVAIYAGNNQILHTYGEGGVTYSDLDATYWKENYMTARRVLS